MEFFVQHGGQQIVKRGLASFAPKQATFAQEKFSSHALVVCVDHERPEPLGREALGNSYGVCRLGDATFEVYDDEDWHSGALLLVVPFLTNRRSHGRYVRCTMVSPFSPFRIDELAVSAL